MLYLVSVITTSYQDVAFDFMSVLQRLKVDYTVSNTSGKWRFEIMDSNLEKWNNLFMEVISLRKE